MSPDPANSIVKCRDDTTHCCASTDCPTCGLKSMGSSTLNSVLAISWVLSGHRQSSAVISTRCVHTSYLTENASRRDRQLILLTRARKKFQYVSACYFEQYHVNSITVLFFLERILRTVVYISGDCDFIECKSIDRLI